jgi:hypothetical protein
MSWVAAGPRACSEICAAPITSPQSYISRTAAEAAYWGKVLSKYTSFTIRRGKLPVRVDTCLDPTDFKPIACPSS